MQTDVSSLKADLIANPTLFLEVVRASASWLERNRERINALNVFPVPDGDTGDNMMLTLRGSLKALEDTEPASLADACDALAEGALQGSRGNSGVILSQMLGGFAGVLRDADQVSAQVLAAAFLRAAEEGFKAHSEPVEGTMMTVMRDLADKAAELATQPLPLAAFLQEVLYEAQRSVERTQTLLPRLQQAGVVDAGGEGIAVLLEGVVRFLRGELTDAHVAPTKGADLDGMDLMEEDVFGYCTNFLLSGEDLDVDAFRQDVLALGKSALVVGNPRSIKVHVHTERPGEILSRALSLGTLHQLKIDNMDDQYQEVLRQRPTPASSEPVVTALVAVVAGAGFRRLFEHDVRAIVVEGGQSMNPSTGDLLQAIERAPSEDVLLLPNNPNVIMSAKRAAEGAKKRVHVLPTRSAPQGMIAALAYSPDTSLEENGEAMQSAILGVPYLEVTRAVRDAQVDGVSVAQGEYIALVDDRLVSSCADLAQTVVAALDYAGVAERELLTLYRGEEASAEAASCLAEQIRGHWPELEVEIQHGGQPHYAYVGSLE